jgi:hypothetical protein
MNADHEEIARNAKIAMSQKRLPELPRLPKIAEIEKQNLPRIYTG